LIISSMSFKCVLNNMGPKTEPCTHTISSNLLGDETIFPILNWKDSNSHFLHTVSGNSRKEILFCIDGKEWYDEIWHSKSALYLQIVNICNGIVPENFFLKSSQEMWNCRMWTEDLKTLKDETSEEIIIINSLSSSMLKTKRKNSSLRQWFKPSFDKWS